MVLVKQWQLWRRTKILCNFKKMYPNYLVAISFLYKNLHGWINKKETNCKTMAFFIHHSTVCDKRLNDSLLVKHLFNSYHIKTKHDLFSYNLLMFVVVIVHIDYYYYYLRTYNHIPKIVCFVQIQSLIQLH